MLKTEYVFIGVDIGISVVKTLIVRPAVLVHSTVLIEGFTSQYK